MNYILLADVIAGVHLAYVACVVFGLLLIVVGHFLRWKWVSNRWFRGIHLAMIVGVVLRTLLWAECPLTWWERDLRELAGQVNFEGSPVGKVMHLMIHPDQNVVPLWVYPPLYAFFGLLIVAALWLAPVNWRTHQSTTEPSSSS